MRPLAEGHGTELRLVAPGGYSPVDMDPRRVRRVLRNLIGNAIEHGEGRPVVITIDSNQHAVAAGVRDFGMGMEPDDAERVFDRFWRADPSRQRTIGGTGLGLSIALGDATLHGGTLAVWSELGVGTNFVLTIPRHDGVLDGPSPVPIEPQEPSPNSGMRPSRSPWPSLLPSSSTRVTDHESDEVDEDAARRRGGPRALLLSACAGFRPAVGSRWGSSSASPRRMSTSSRGLRADQGRRSRGDRRGIPRSGDHDVRQLATAREFLAPDLQRTWRPAAGVSIDTGTDTRTITSTVPPADVENADSADVQVLLDLVASVDDANTYSEALGASTMAVHAAAHGGRRMAHHGSARRDRDR